MYGILLEKEKCSNYFEKMFQSKFSGSVSFLNFESSFVPLESDLVMVLLFAHGEVDFLSDGF